MQCCTAFSCPRVSDSLWPHGLKSPSSSVYGDSPGKNAMLGDYIHSRKTPCSLTGWHECAWGCEQWRGAGGWFLVIGQPNHSKLNHCGNAQGLPLEPTLDLHDGGASGGWSQSVTDLLLEWLMNPIPVCLYLDLGAELRFPAGLLSSTSCSTSPPSKARAASPTKPVHITTSCCDCYLLYICKSRRLYLSLTNTDILYWQTTCHVVFSIV